MLTKPFKLIPTHFFQVSCYMR